MSGDPRFKPSGYFDRESDTERGEYLQERSEVRAERQRDDEMLDGKAGSDVDKFLDGKIEE